MKLKEAKICLDCDEVFEGGNCPRCGSEQVVYLNTWLLPPDEKERYFGFLGVGPASPKGYAVASK